MIKAARGAPHSRTNKILLVAAGLALFTSVVVLVPSLSSGPGNNRILLHNSNSRVSNNSKTSHHSRASSESALK